MFKAIALVSGILLISACGGGSDGGTSTPSPPPFSITPSSITDINEGQSVAFDLTPSNAKGQVTTNVVVSNAGNTLTLTKVSETTYTLTPANVDRDLEASISWTAQDGTSTATQKSGTAEFTIKNTSFAQALAEIEVFSSNKDRVTGFTEEKLLLSALRDIATVLGENAANVASAGIEPQDAQTFSDEFDELVKAVDNYNAGQAGDAELSEVYAKSKETFENMASPYKSKLNTNLAAMAKDGKALVQVSQFFVNTELGTVSMLFGNAELGSVQNGQWVFNDSVAYLNDLVENTGCSL